MGTFRTALRFLIFNLLLPVIFRPVMWLLGIVFNLLCKWFPTIFRIYSIITEKAAYERQQLLISVIALAFSVFITVFLAVAFDNGKNEFLISKTEGFYTLKGGFSVYKSKFLTFDILLSFSIPSILYALSFIPIDFPAGKLSVLEKYLTLFFVPYTSLSEYFGIVPGEIILIFICVAALFPAIFSGLKRWRASWLSDFDEVAVK
jgi:hypothetical protein